MKKIFIFYCLFIFSSIILYSQTWTEISGFGGNTVWNVITKEQWDRFRLQNLEDYNFTDLLYTDLFEMEIGSNNKVISGTRPTFNGYYYLYGKNQGYTVIAYGNSNTGRMEILFCNYDYYNYTGRGVHADSNSYITLYNRFIRRVNGE